MHSLVGSSARGRSSPNLMCDPQQAGLQGSNRRCNLKDECLRTAGRGQSQPEAHCHCLPVCQ
jgi:hypothetical protein